MRYFAIGLQKWVEIRRAKAPPKRYQTSTDTIVNRNVRHYDYMTGGVRNEVVKQKLVMQVVRYTGGRLVKTLRRDSFRRRVGITIDYGHMIELLPDQCHKLRLDTRQLDKPTEVV
jgi:hypothetical protein